MRRKGVLLLALALLGGCDGGTETGRTARVRIAPAPAAPAAREPAVSQLGAGGGASPPAPAAASRACAPIRFKARASSAAVAGGAGAEAQNRRAGEPDCYTLAVGEGQRAEVRLLPGSGPDVAVTIAGVGEAQDRFAFTTRRGTYEILVFQTRRDRPPQPYRLSVAVSALQAAGAGEAAPGSCGAELGAKAAALVRRCIEVSPATHPPCHADNPCAMIRNEIARGCAQRSPADRPDFCGGDLVDAAPAAGDAAWVVGTWAPTALGCQGEDLAVTYFASGNYAAHGEVGRWKLAGERLSWTATEATGEVPAGDVAVGRTVSASVTRLGADEMAFEASDGGRTRLRRCP